MHPSTKQTLQASSATTPEPLGLEDLLGRMTYEREGGVLRVRQLGEMASRRPLNADEALELVTLSGEESFWALLDGADRLRRLHRGESVTLCAIVNAQSGRCPEDCGFCAQSAHFDTDIVEHDFLPKEDILDAARRAAAMGATEFSLVIAGRKIRRRELDLSKEIFPAILKETGLSPCASLGVVNEGELEELKDAGLRMFHHNLETSRGHYPQVCSTRPYEANRDTVLAAKRQGFFVCSGGIFGMGESWEQRVELFIELRELEVDSIPINFLNPIPGTPFADMDELTPRTCLKIIALARHLLPNRQILVCGGRDVNLRDMQSLIFRAGASGMMIGNYLTTKGRRPEADRQMLEDLGIPIAPCLGHARGAGGDSGAA